MELLTNALILVATVWIVEGKVPCPGGQYQCPDRTTCCLLASGQYGCCPMEKAVCCSDHSHCCPHGTTCDLPHQRCQHADGRNVPWASKVEATRTPEVVLHRGHNSVICPDHASECPDGSTCCEMSSGQYGCCPMPQAVCCSDQVHCCPHGSTCDLTRRTCRKRDGTYEGWHTKFGARRRGENGVICPDGQSECPSGSTCCRMPNGAWGCCPIRNAVCCSDHVHCCPHGTTCDAAHGRCSHANRSVSRWLTKSPSRSVSTVGHRKPARTMCQDGVSSCAHGSTCCQRQNRGWNCCPHVNGVCCSDKEHCCPQNTHCDIHRGRCIVEGAFMVPWSVSFGSNTIEQARSQEKQCSDGSWCPTPGTCCRPRYGHQYKCCSIPNAVCCGNHCCPAGYRCSRGPGFQCVKDAKQRPELALSREIQDNTLSEEAELL